MKIEYHEAKEEIVFVLKILYTIIFNFHFSFILLTICSCISGKTSKFIMKVTEINARSFPNDMKYTK